MSKKKEKERNEEEAAQEVRGKAFTLLKEIGEVIVIIFVILLVLRLAFGPTAGLMPMVGVESGSMEHHSDSWEIWLKSHGLSETEIEKFPFQDGFNTGDMIVTRWGEVKLGDVIIFKRDLGHWRGNEPPLIHRVVGIVEIRNWEVKSISGTTDCIDKQIYTTHIPLVMDCASADQCLYPDPERYQNQETNAGNFTLYVTKGDNNRVSDQCGNLAYPVTAQQVITKAWLRIPKIGYLIIWKWQIIPAIIIILIIAYGIFEYRGKKR